jgi:hypothetical protein
MHDDGDTSPPVLDADYRFNLRKYAERRHECEVHLSIVEQQIAEQLARPATVDQTAYLLFLERERSTYCFALRILADIASLDE